MALVASAALVVVAIKHAGMSCWIQGLNYGVATVPFNLACGHALRYRLHGLARSRRFAGYYAVAFLVIALYSWLSVERYRDSLTHEEQALQPTIARIEAYRAAHGRYPDDAWERATTTALRFPARYHTSDGTRFLLFFPHNLVRRHVYLSDTGAWTDEE